jgi:hypothetical protein
MDIELSPIAFEEAFIRIRRAADQVGEVSDTRAQAILDEVISGSEMLQGVAESFR